MQWVIQYKQLTHQLYFSSSEHTNLSAEGNHRFTFWWNKSSWTHQTIFYLLCNLETELRIAFSALYVIFKRNDGGPSLEGCLSQHGIFILSVLLHSLYICTMHELTWKAIFYRNPYQIMFSECKRSLLCIAHMQVVYK